MKLLIKDILDFLDHHLPDFHFDKHALDDIPEDISIDVDPEMLSHISDNLPDIDLEAHDGIIDGDHFHKLELILGLETGILGVLALSENKRALIDRLFSRGKLTLEQREKLEKLHKLAKEKQNENI